MQLEVGDVVCRFKFGRLEYDGYKIVSVTKTLAKCSDGYTVFKRTLIICPTPDDVLFSARVCRLKDTFTSPDFFVKKRNVE